MPDTYPFRGVWRWLLLPLWMAAAGATGGWLEAAHFGRLDYWPVFVGQDASIGFAAGLALTLGPRPILALVASLVLGFLEPQVSQAALRAYYGSVVSLNVGVERGVAGAVEAAALVAAHLLYLKKRRVLWAGGVYSVAACLSVTLWEGIGGDFSAAIAVLSIARRAALSWLTMTGAVRVLGERPR